jgi:tetratricopeptide (TPR) repeat protein
MGVVYEAFDREQQLAVALKTLQRADPAGLLQIKEEFRSLRDISHPNLVALGELFEEEGHWFFTMELVAGVDFVEYVRPHRPTTGDGSTRTGPRDTPTAAEERSESGPDTPRGAAPIPRGPQGGDDCARMFTTDEEERLRRALEQLIEAADTLHAHGMVHRDLKPSNVLVTPEGRVVVLDFGLVTGSSASGRPGGAPPRTIAGTPRYMAPEQMTRATVGPPSDWYSVGVMVYEALTGAPMLTGTASDILRAKLRGDLGPPSSIASGVPADLDHLCARLLAREPDMRPTGAELRQRWGILRSTSTGRGDAAPAVEPAPPSAHPAGTFVGRERELAWMSAEVERARAGEAPCIVVQGESGVGKTALVRELVRRILVDASDALVLAGRSHERESVPFKAIDGIVDGLVRHLLSLRPAARDALGDPNAASLAQLFPVLEHVPEIARARSAAPLGEARDQRRRAFEALRALVGRIAESALLLVVLDDLQWADDDSLQLLREVLRDPRPAGLVVLALVRAPAGAEWRPPSMSRDELLGKSARTLALGPLAPDEGAQLVRALMPARAAISKQVAEALVSSASGHPMFIHELVRHAREGGARDAAHPAEELDLEGLDLDRALWSRIERLEPAPRTLLLRIALAGIPVTNDALRRASQLPGPEYARAIDRLAEGSLARLSGRRRRDAVEPFHDRVRETVVRHASEDTRRGAHRELAEALELTAPGEHETLATHWEGAGEHAKAAQYAGVAARAAEGMLAFDRAARLYGLCLALSGSHIDPGRRRELSLLRAEALVNAGRYAEAAAVYGREAERAPPDRALDLVRLAAERYLQAGRLDEGIPRLDRALAPLGLSFRPTSPWTIARLLAERMRVRVRGLGYVERTEREVDPALLAQLDVLWAATATLGHLDPVAGNRFSTRLLRIALEAGEPHRIARALICEWTYEAALRIGGSRRARELEATIDALVTRMNEPYLFAFRSLVGAMVALTRDGEPDRCLELVTEARTIFAGCRGVAWESAAAELFYMGALHYSGRWGELKQVAMEAYRLARQSGDYSRLGTALLNTAWLVADLPDEAEAGIEEVMRPYEGQPFLVMHYHETMLRSHIAIYRGDPGAYFDECERAWREVKRKLLDRIPLVSATLTMQRARGALAIAAAARGSARAAMLVRARALVPRLRRSHIGWARHHAELIAAGVAHLEGDRRAAIMLLERAERSFERAGIVLHPAIAMQRRAELVGGARGAALAATAAARMRDNGVVAPERMVRALAPGFG